MKTEKSNKELLLLLQSDDSLAFYQIYERYCKRLYGFVLRYVKQAEDAEGIVQEVFIKVWEKRKKIDVSSSFESFLFTVTYNTIISLLRKRLSEKKYLENLKTIQQVEFAADLVDEIHYREINKKVEALLNEVTPRQKEVFLLSRADGLSHQEIADKLGISALTVKKHVSNTLSFLKSHIDKGLMEGVLFVCLFF